MTDNDSTKKFEQKLSGSVVVESHLCNRLVETLNAEISQGVVTDIPNALAWLKSTFLFVRMQKRPQYYNVPEAGNTPEHVESQLKKLCMDALKSLTELDIVRMTDDIDVSPNAGSKIMARHMVPLQAMERFVKLEFDGFDLRGVSPTSRSDELIRRIWGKTEDGAVLWLFCVRRINLDGLSNAINAAIFVSLRSSQLVHVLSQCEEMHASLRRDEKKVLNELHKEVRFRILSDLAPSKVKVSGSESQRTSPVINSPRLTS